MVRLCSYEHKKEGNKCSSVSVKWAMRLMYSLDVRLDNQFDVLKSDTAVQLCVQLGKGCANSSLREMLAHKLLSTVPPTLRDNPTWCVSNSVPATRLVQHSSIVIAIGLSCQNVDGMNSIDFILTVSRFSIEEKLLCENCLYLFSPSPIQRLTMSSVAVGF